MSVPATSGMTLLPESEAIRVFIVEDETFIRESLCEAVCTDPRLSLSGSSGSLAEASRWLSDGRRRVDVLLVDLGLPDGSGLELINQCHSMRPEVDVMVLTVFGDAQNVFAALGAGASGYLLKTADVGVIVQHVLELRAGGSPISPSIARLVLSRMPNVAQAEADASASTGGGEPMPTPLEPLSAREVDVLKMITAGYSYAETARKLFISTHTVNAHIRSIYRKLQVRTRGEAAYVATRTGIIPLT